MSKRVREAEAADRAELQAVANNIVRSPEDYAAWNIARYEAETGNVATPEDWAQAREDAHKAFKGAMSQPVERYECRECGVPCEDRRDKKKTPKSADYRCPRCGHYYWERKAP